MYTILKFIHVVSIAVWFGGLVTMIILNAIFRKAGDHSLLQTLGRQGKALSFKLFMPAMLVAVVTGIGMVQVGNLNWGSFWVSWGFVGAFLSLLFGGILTGGTASRLAKKVAAGEIDAAGIAATQRRIVMFSIVNMLVLLVTIYMMVAKPD